MLEISDRRASVLLFARDYEGSYSNLDRVSVNGVPIPTGRRSHLVCVGDEIGFHDVDGGVFVYCYIGAQSFSTADNGKRFIIIDPNTFTFQTPNTDMIVLEFDD